MPATRIVVLERSRRIEPRLRRAVVDNPVKIQAARTTEELIERLNGHPGSIALIELCDSLDQTIPSIESARGRTECVLVFASGPLTSEGKCAVRLAGAVGIIWEMPSDETWRALVTRWVGESQRQLALGDPSR